MGLKENDEDRSPFQCLLDAVALVERLDEETMRLKLKQGLNKIDDNLSGVDTQPINFTTVRIFGTDIIIVAIDEDVIMNQLPTGSSKKRKERFKLSRAKKLMPKQKRKKHKHKATFGDQSCFPQSSHMIKCMDGSEKKLIIQKALHKTDLSKHHGRLSIPMNQVEVEFLIDEELKQRSK
ncbi:hypothetical protein J1N35_024855 [Gossypium stocksii]|uniref:Uncharacterized protein n=1 Tax=Gossypium stocksii TaxID=47602 RepID=A0A9D3ZWN5_9ROSI|nr:hypothetical protein J1N35_024855 [Gossypium stocksii]